MAAKRVAAEVPVDLRRRLDRLAPRDAGCGRLVAAAAEPHGVSRATLYRQLGDHRRPRPAHRADRGRPRAMPVGALERYRELVAALKVRTENRKGRRLPTARAIALLERHGVGTPEGLVQAPAGRLSARPSTATWRSGGSTTIGSPGRRPRCADADAL